MNAAAKFIEQISAAGISISAEGDALAITPASKLTAEQRTFIREHKTDLLTELQAVRASEAVLEPCQPGADIEVANDAGGTDLTDDEHSLLVQMGLHWGYSPADWQTLWDACQDPAQRANWVRIAESERPPAPDVDDPEQSITVRVEADIGAGRKRFDMLVPLDRWDEAAFSGQIAKLNCASWWKLGEPRRCSDCRHQKRTSHPALVTCSSPEGDHFYPGAGGHWGTDERMCRGWAPTSRTDTRGQTASTESGATP
ncbi:MULTISPECIES: hypothetical protein [unclassified Methylococcus]|uniref:TubC N-terminal docking domain-related protein n=1 Tax=unclassified Methylococcus TaxID=2618889 RepID=UPI003D7DE651